MRPTQTRKNITQVEIIINNIGEYIFKINNYSHNETNKTIDLKKFEQEFVIFMYNLLRIII